jgi:hypothetical protein
MDKVRDIFSYFVAALTMFAFLGAVYQAFQNEKGSAVTLGTLFLIGALIVFLPQVEFIKTLGVEAKLRQTVNEATVILERLKRLSAISAKSTYLNMAWSNRMGSPSAKEKQAVLDEVESQLIDLKVSPEERAEIARPFVRIIGFDLYMAFGRTIQSYGAPKGRKLQALANASQTVEHRDAVEEHTRRITAWSKRTAEENPITRLNTYDLKTELDREMPTPDEWLNERERRIAQRFEQQILDLYAGCEKKGGFTPEAADFYDKYSDNSERNAQELFQQALDEIK